MIISWTNVYGQSTRTSWNTAPPKLLELYEKAKGKPAETIEELTKWMMSPAGKLATAGDPIHATVGL